MTDRDYIREHAILYVDDERPNLVVFDAAYGGEFSILCAESGEEALRILASRPVAVLLADLNMPRMTGVELCARVARDHPGVRRLIVTAYADQRAAMDAINRGGVSGFLQKPLEGEEVRRALRDAIADVRLEQSARRLRAAMTERDRLATAATVRAGLLHDLANTHNAIGAACEKLEALAPEHMTGTAREELGHLRAALDFAVGLLHGRARFLSARENRTPELHEAGEAILTVSRLLRGQQGSARLVTHCPERLDVYADRIDVCRILVNLLTNSFRALEEENVVGGTVRLEASRAGADVCFTVSDNGPGVPAEIQPLLFTARTPRATGGGGGMGLPLSRALAAANGGALRLHEASGPGHTAFVLTLPAAPPATASSTGPVALVG